MEACFVNLIEPKDLVLILKNGVFGVRMEEVATRLGAEVDAIEFEWGTPVIPEKVKEKLYSKSYKVVAMVHAETSTEAAMSRNRSRKERSLPDFIVEKTSKAVQESVKKYREELGDKLIEIDTETIEYGKPLPKDFVNKVKTKVYENERGVLNADR